MKRVEQQAIEVVMTYERKQGRKPKDVHTLRKGYDIESDNRLIEVKGQSKKRPGSIWIKKTLLKKLGKGVMQYHVYIVYGLNPDESRSVPKIKILPPALIFSNLQIDTVYLISAKAVSSGVDAKL